MAIPPATVLVLRPKADTVIVELISDDMVGGVVMPDISKERPQEGRVLFKGPGRRYMNGELVPIDCEIGERVLFQKYTGNKVTIDGHEVVIIREANLLTGIE